MEVNRLGSTKVLKYRVVVDTNILLQAVRNNIDLFEKLADALVAKFEIIVPEVVVRELENLRSKGRPIERREAELVFKTVISKSRIVPVREQYSRVDDAILSVALDYNAILLTNDKELRRRARLLRIPVARLNIKGRRVFVEGVFD